eukprot:TRINITY_DN12199_c0_g1_i2.p1 TRINITY_DN12199_c0_g1~~TRINITY_DN12199_c0_g1_i2.p1  ORF type:complete len:271 (-),score=9.40 TRINITY_DN12199_c0_g1_i2:474-1286(-)
MSEPPARKRPAENASTEVQLPGEPAMSWMSAFRTMFSEELKPVTRRADAIETLTNTMQVNMSSLAERVTRLEEVDTSSTTGSTSNSSKSAPRSVLATNVELKERCSWNERASKGLDRVKAIQLVNGLCAALPVDCQTAVSDPVLFGFRSASILVPVASDHIREVAGYWKEMVASQDYQNRYPGCFARLEVSVERKAAKSLLARAPRSAEHHLKAPSHEVRPFLGTGLHPLQHEPDKQPVARTLPPRQLAQEVHLDQRCALRVQGADAHRP